MLTPISVLQKGRITEATAQSRGPDFRPCKLTAHPPKTSIPNKCTPTKTKVTHYVVVLSLKILLAGPALQNELDTAVQKFAPRHYSNFARNFMLTETVLHTRKYAAAQKQSADVARAI